VSLFEEAGLLPEIFDAERYKSDSQQRLALSAIVTRLRNHTLVRAVEGAKWKKEAFKYGKSPAAKKVLELLMMQRRIIYEENRTPKSSQDWLAAYAESHKNREIRLIISDDRSGSKPEFIPAVTSISEVVEQNWWSELTLNAEVKNIDSFVATIRLPLRCAGRIELIDPYLLPTTGLRGPLLQRIVQETIDNPRNPWVKIHSSLKALEEENEDVWRSHFSALEPVLLKRDRAVQVFIWRPKHLPDAFHDRYLLTDIGSCSVGRGFEIIRGHTNRLYRLDHPTHERIQQAFRTGRNAENRTVCRFSIGSRRSRWFDCES
jgi:hypothetical protein